MLNGSTPVVMVTFKAQKRVRLSQVNRDSGATADQSRMAVNNSSGMRCEAKLCVH